MTLSSRLRFEGLLRTLEAQQGASNDELRQESAAHNDKVRHFSTLTCLRNPLTWRHYGSISHLANTFPDVLAR